MDKDRFIQSFEIYKERKGVKPSVILGGILIILDILLMSGVLQFGFLKEAWGGTPMEHFIPGPNMGFILTIAGIALIVLGLIPAKYISMDLYYDGIVFHKPKGGTEEIRFDDVETIIRSQQGRGFDKTLFIRFENGKSRQILLPPQSEIPEHVTAAWNSYCRMLDRLYEEEQQYKEEQ